MSSAAYAALPRHEVTLVLGGKGYLGWTEIEIDRGLDTLVGAFSLTLTTREGTDAPEFPIKAGDECAVVLGGKPLITGYVDQVAKSIDAEQHSLTVTGRDKACDLVDCSAVHSPGSWRNAKLDAIARELAAPFGVAIAVTGDVGNPLARFAIQPGETAFAAIERLARYRGLIAFSDGAGGVIVGNPDSGKRAGRLAEGENIVSLGMTVDHAERFSSYIAKGQSSGSDQRHGKAVAQVKGTASDTGVARYRPMLVVGEEQSDAASLAKRAQWEATVRAARAETITAVVPGWFAGDGSASAPVWEPGARAECISATLGLSGDRLIERVRLTRGGDGSRAELTLAPPAAWTQLAETEKAEA